MKICHLTTVHPYMDTRILIKECYSLSKEGYEMHFVAPDAPDEIIHGIALHSIRKSGKSRVMRMIRSSIEIFKKALEIKADVYHFHDPELLIVGTLLKLKRRKVVYDVHEDVPRQILSKYWIPSIFRKLVSNLFENIENFISKKVDGIIAATPHIGDRFKKLGCNVEVVSNYPIISELFTPDFNWSQKKDAICYIGGIAKVRGICEMLAALERSNSKLILAGWFSPSQLELELKEHSGWENVDFKGKLDRSGIKEVLSMSKAGLVVLHPIINYIDALPVKMFEYMAAGIPVIASNFPLWKAIIDKYQCGICVDPLNSKEIATAIEWIINNPNEAERLGRNGRRAIEDEYNWEIEAVKLSTFYTRL